MQADKEVDCATKDSKNEASANDKSKLWRQIVHALKSSETASHNHMVDVGCKALLD